MISSKELHTRLSNYFASSSLPGEPFQDLMMPEARKKFDFGHTTAPKKSAVLMLLYPDGDQWQMVLTKRHEYNGSHSAQVCLPGGKKEKIDTDLLATAIRETSEEIGYDCHREKVTGMLSPVYIHVSNYMVEPYIAVLSEKPQLNIDKKEVNYLIDLAVDNILLPEFYSTKKLIIKDMTFTTPIFIAKDDFIWGATAMMLSEFAEILKRCELTDHI
jgi:8-oxo-dGTP pyrophosphatase MutT (NUDIX family)